MQVSDLGDHIGMESCIDLNATVDTHTHMGGGEALTLNHRKPRGLNKCRSSMHAKELPPPLPIQSSTAFKRYYTDDGRLIIVEEKIESPKFQFTAHRSHGRLTLRLVQSEGSNKMTVDGEDDGGSGSRFGCNATVRAAATGPCFLVDQNHLHVIRPVRI
ncbi:hypothetical protein R6Q59_019520 [Mikania micrantha]|uniref:FAF domain-containing protein n=1 Tax=Mikania micrantha TaxID=192012 RepID=A0A5N6PSP4_9ASTR|nr:hypothetical protein E3N88_07607 [Mikania micrantha]